MCFLVCGFLGWCFETLAIFVQSGQWEARGFLFVMEPVSHYITKLKGITFFDKVPLVWGLPFIFIYAIGGTIVCVVFRNWGDRPVKLFFAGVILLTLLELTGSYICEYLIHEKYWDYSDDFMNFQGRICLRASITWGFVTVFVIKAIMPLLRKLYNCTWFRPHFELIVKILVAYIIVCIIIKFAIKPPELENGTG